MSQDDPRKDELDLRRAIIDKCRWMNANGLNQGTSGNISARCGDRMLITPEGVDLQLRIASASESAPPTLTS